jgi:hypothetical protein
MVNALQVSELTVPGSVSLPDRAGAQGTRS